MRTRIRKSLVSALLLFSGWSLAGGGAALAQAPPRGVPGGPGGRRGPPGAERLEVRAQFDKDGDGLLDDAERVEARAFVEKQREEMGRRGRGGRRGGFFRGPDDRSEPPVGEAEKVELDSGVPSYRGHGLYDPSVLRTLFLSFASDDWEEEVAAFYRTDVEVPAELTVDGETYPSVGVRFRGNSSFFGVPPGKKRSLNVSIDYGEKGRDLYGYKTLNLLNSNQDPTFLRAVLFYTLAGDSMPALRVNLVKVVINGESWGIYANVQQYNRDFMEENFGSRDGARWKVPQGPGGAGSLAFSPGEEEAYRRSFQLKAADDETAAWARLEELARVLEETPAERLEAALTPILDVDGALWFLAIDNVFTDGDGYLSRGSDYHLVLDAANRFHFLHYDSNETFGIGGGPGRFGGGPPGGGGGRFRGPPPEFAPDGFPGRPNEEGRTARDRRPDADGGRESEDDDRGRRGRRGGFGRGGPREDPVRRDPLALADDPERPLLSKLLAVPSLRARYLAHVRTLAEETLDWEHTGPLVESLHRLIAEEVAKDVRKLYSTDAFLEGIEQDTESGRGSVPGLKPFFAKRREFLLAHPLIAAPRAAVASVGHASVAVDASVTVSAMVSGDVPADEVYLYHSAEFGRPFSRRAMRRGDTEGVYVGEIPAAAAGATVRYYVEARAGSDPVTSSFFPRRAEAKALSYHVSAAVGTAGDAVFPVRINEIMAQNRASVADPQGEFDDWIELYNAGDEAVDLSELYLSDDAKNPRLWRFPRGTAIAPGGYLMVWADADGTDRPGLHASFKLSREGARVLLVDADARQNHILDELLFEALETDRSLARTRDGGGFELQEATPGRENR